MITLRSTGSTFTKYRASARTRLLRLGEITLPSLLMNPKIINFSPVSFSTSPRVIPTNLHSSGMRTSVMYSLSANISSLPGFFMASLGINRQPISATNTTPNNATKPPTGEKSNIPK